MKQFWRMQNIVRLKLTQTPLIKRTDFYKKFGIYTHEFVHTTNIIASFSIRSVRRKRKLFDFLTSQTFQMSDLRFNNSACELLLRGDINRCLNSVSKRISAHLIYNWYSDIIVCNYLHFINSVPFGTFVMKVHKTRTHFTHYNSDLHVMEMLIWSTVNNLFQLDKGVTPDILTYLSYVKVLCFLHLKLCTCQPKK
jgi:hypothetical protein